MTKNEEKALLLLIVGGFAAWAIHANLKAKEAAKQVKRLPIDRVVPAPQPAASQLEADFIEYLLS
jgi:hypothetical protein